MNNCWPPRKPPNHFAHWLALPLLLATTALPAMAQTWVAVQAPLAHVPANAPSPTPEMAVPHDLANYVQMALQRQPRIEVERASLAAAEDGRRAVENLRLAAIIDHEIPIRRRQACLGVSAAAAGVDQAERETVYAVTRAYFTVLYAHEQLRITNNVVERLSATYESAQQQLKQGARDVSATDVNRALVYLRQAQARQAQTAQGEKRALAALKEAIGLGCDMRLAMPAGRLPDPAAQPSQEEVVALALARRGDLAQATLFAQVACLEVEAQATGMLKRMSTFAAGADIHATQVPQASRGAEYRPGAVAPAMPTSLAGSRSDRIKHAESLQGRAEAAVAVTRNLIALEAEDAFLRWEEAAQQVPQAREAAEAGDKLADDLTRDYTAGLKVRTEDVLTARVLAAQSRAQYNEYLYHKILALADLERITAGGFCPRLFDLTLPEALPVSREGNGGK